ncbi:MAG: sulfite exporter TauE/SafE family protein [Actinomyces graevenitzii]|jgi:possible membrane protein|uniref:Probable membrane transporter protein n=1 Tax=Actinomyces graevenitzii TaxID=55565 RepID=A0A9E7ANQ0_9ACTO|nr:sulfite exporter TauE/SafE family protein [Actinomyces graevenitzii]UQF80359.1 MAG: sulfite exporter TauE/SafE family protein [Actinomyces graevenitzii]
MILTALAVGALIGLVVGALGAGGGILSVPALIYLLGVAPHEATSASLVIVLFTALAALGGRIGKNTICYQIALVFAALATVGTWLGSLANQAVSADLLMYAFALLLICVGLVMLRRAYPGLFRGAARAGSSGVFSDDGAAAADNVGGTSSTPALRAVSAMGEVTSIGAVPLWRVALVATITGALTGFFGVGGGFAIVPALTLVLHLPIKRAASTSLLIMAITAVVALVARAQTSLNVDLGVIGAFTVASMLGAVAGAPLTRKVSSQKLTASFAALLLAVAVATLVGQS